MVRRFGLIGYPLGHSFSARYFAGKFAAEGIDARYDLYPIPDVAEAKVLLQGEPALEGFNVTIPYKEAIIPMLDALSPDARAIGAVNVVRRIRDGHGGERLEGHNTDWSAFGESLRPLLRPDITGALVLGSGGAAKAVRYALGQLGLEVLTVSRTPGGCDGAAVSYAELDESLMLSHLLIVNTTPLGMYPHVDSCPDIPYSLVTPRHVCYDLVYNPEETRFMRLCAERGALTKNGAEMLLRQAEKSWLIWNE